MAYGDLKCNNLIYETGSGDVTIAISTIPSSVGPTFTQDVTFTGASSNGIWDASANAFVANLTGNVTGNCSGSALTVTQAAQSAITSVGQLTSVDIAGPYKQTVVAITQSATPTVNLSTGNYFTLTQNAAITQWTFSNPPASRSFSFVIELANASYATAWSLASGTIKWPADTAPTLSASKTHLIILTTDDGGTTYRASSIVDYTT